MRGWEGELVTSRDLGIAGQVSWLAVVGLLISACQGDGAWPGAQTLTLDEAKSQTAGFVAPSFKPAHRTLDDLLEQLGDLRLYSIGGMGTDRGRFPHPQVRHYLQHPSSRLQTEAKKGSV